MAEAVPSLSTDQLAAFVELAREGSLRSAAENLHITEQGLRNRLISLEERLNVQLYAKRRGPKRGECRAPAQRLENLLRPGDQSQPPVACLPQPRDGLFHAAFVVLDDGVQRHAFV